MRSDSEDDISTVARDEESEEMSSPKRMRNESDDETSTVSNKDIFSSSDDDKSSEETDDASNATAELHTKHSDLVQSFENEGFSEIDAKKQAFAAILPLFDQCLSLITTPLHQSLRVRRQIQENDWLKRDIGTRKCVPSECLVMRDA